MRTDDISLPGLKETIDPNSEILSAIKASFFSTPLILEPLFINKEVKLATPMRSFGS